MSATTTRTTPRTSAGPATTAVADHLPPEVWAWARAIEAGVLARAARDDPEVHWRGDATDDELRALEAAGAVARQEFVTANLGLVGSVVGSHARAGVPIADLFQEGCLGLLAAIERFDHQRGVQFSTYATYWIRTGVTSAVSRLAGAVTLPASRGDQLRVALGVEGALAQQLGRQPTAGEVGAVLGRDGRWTARLLDQRSARSIDELDDRSLHRLCAEAPQPGDGLEPDPEVWARRLLAGLDAFDRRVLELRLGFGGQAPTSLAGTARELEVPVGRVRRAEVRALELLRGRCPRAVLPEVAS